MKIKLIIRSVLVIATCGLSVPNISGTVFVPSISTIGTVLKWTLAAGPTYFLLLPSLYYVINPESSFKSFQVKEPTEPEKWFLDDLKTRGVENTPVYIVKKSPEIDIVGGLCCTHKGIFISEHPAAMEQSLHEAVKTRDLDSLTQYIAVANHENRHVTAHHQAKRIAWALTTPLLTSGVVALLKKTIMPAYILSTGGAVGSLLANVAIGIALCASNFYLQSKLEQKFEFEADAAIPCDKIYAAARFLNALEYWAKKDMNKTPDNIQKEYSKKREGKSTLTRIVANAMNYTAIVKETLFRSHPTIDQRIIALSKRQHDELEKQGLVEPESYEPSAFYPYGEEFAHKDMEL